MFRALFTLISSVVVFYSFYSLFMTEVRSYDEEKIAFFLSAFIMIVYGVSVFFLFSP